MPDPRIVEHYAYATDDREVVTLEARHPLITDPGTGSAGAIRLASVFVTPREIEDAPFFEARLEADAPLDPGAVVSFNRAPIEIVRPSKSATGVPRVRLRFSNVDARITEAFIAASKSSDPVALTIRAFTMATRLSGEPDVLDGFELVEPEIGALGVEVSARAPDVINIPFHQVFYDTRFPLIGV